MSRVRLLTGLLVAALIVLAAFRPWRRPTVTTSSHDIHAEPAGLQPQPIHSLRSEDFLGGDHYLVRNLVAGPIGVRCRLTDAQNVVSEPPLPRAMVVPAMAELELSELRSADRNRKSHASIECDAIVGDPGAKPTGFEPYALPFYPGARFTLDQGFNGVFSHNDAESRYALDLGVPDGTPVLAARGGVVMQVEEDFRGGGEDLERYGDRANYVRVLHDDGSMAVYAHLAPHSTLYRPGDRVRAGDFLGKSGNTGYSTGPHLHFSVQKNVGMTLQSIPFTMIGVDPYHPR